MLVLLHAMLLAFGGGILCGAGCRLGRLAAEQVRLYWIERDLNRNRVRRIDRIERTVLGHPEN